VTSSTDDSNNNDTGRCDIITIEAGGHGMGTWKDADQQHYKSEMIAWLKRTTLSARGDSNR